MDLEQEEQIDSELKDIFINDLQFWCLRSCHVMEHSLSGIHVL